MLFILVTGYLVFVLQLEEHTHITHTQHRPLWSLTFCIIHSVGNSHQKFNAKNKMGKCAMLWYFILHSSFGYQKRARCALLCQCRMWARAHTHATDHESSEKKLVGSADIFLLSSFSLFFIQTIKKKYKKKSFFGTPNMKEDTERSRNNQQQQKSRMILASNLFESTSDWSISSVLLCIWFGSPVRICLVTSACACGTTATANALPILTAKIITRRQRPTQMSDIIKKMCWYTLLVRFAVVCCFSCRLQTLQSGNCIAKSKLVTLLWCTSTKYIIFAIKKKYQLRCRKAHSVYLCIYIVVIARWRWLEIRCQNR